MAYPSWVLEPIPDTEGFFKNVTELELSTLHTPPPTIRSAPKRGATHYPLTGINPQGHTPFSIDQLVVLDAMNIRRLVHFKNHGVLQPWKEHLDEFEKRYMWRPAESRLEAFAQSMEKNPNWFLTYQMESLSALQKRAK